MADEPTQPAEDQAADTDASPDTVRAAEQALADTEQAADQVAEATDQANNLDLPTFQRVLADVEAAGLDMLQDVDLNVKIELGRTHMLVEDVLRLNEGSVVELDKLAGDPVDIFVNERLVARGEVIVVNDNFCVRVSELIGEVPIEDAAAEQAAETAPADDQPAASAPAE